VVSSISAVPLKVDPRVGTHPKASAAASRVLFVRLDTVKREGCKETVGSLEDLGIISGPPDNEMEKLVKDKKTK